MKFYNKNDLKDLQNDLRRQNFVTGCDRKISATEGNMKRRSSYSNMSTHNPRERQLLDAILRVQQKLDETALQRNQLEASKKFLRARIRNLEEKLTENASSPDLGLISEHPTVTEVGEICRLTEAAREASQRQKRLRELAAQERSLKESVIRAEEVASLGSRLSASDISCVWSKTHHS